MIDQQLEFSISQYLDGTLPPGEVALLEKRLAADPAAGKLLDQYRQLDALLRQTPEVGAVRWNQLAGQIAQSALPASAELSGSITETSFPANTDKLELAISQYLDGHLPATEAAELEHALASDPFTRRLLAEHQSLDTLLKHALSTPAVDWDKLSSHLSNQVADLDAPPTYSIAAWLGRAGHIAIAASVLLAIGLAAYFGSGSHQPIGPGGPVVAIAQVTVCPPEAASGAAMVQVTFDRSDEVAQSNFDPYASGVVTRPSTVELAVNLPASPDGMPLPW